MVERYTAMLLERGIILEFQPPNSPDTNMLVLGVWMSLQNCVDKLSNEKRQNKEALAETVEEAWEMFAREKKEEHANIRKRLVTNAKLTILDKGGNDYVEARGKLKGELLEKWKDEAGRLRMERAEDSDKN